MAFTTLGDPWFHATSAAIPAPGAMTMTVEIGSCGPVPATVTCWFGTSPESLGNIHEWTGQTGSPVLDFTQSGLQVGGVYYYAFTIDCRVDAQTAWTVWSATNAFTIAGATTWIGTGDWHTSGNWDNGVPGPAAVANFHKAGTMVTAQNDLAVKEAVINDNGLVTFNLGQNALRVSDRFNIGGNAVAGYPAAGGAVLKLTNGIIDAGAKNIIIGDDTNDNALFLEGTGVITANELTIGTGPNSTRGVRNHLAVIGPDARLQVAILRVGGPQKAHDNTFLLQNAVMTNTTFIVGGGTESQRAIATLDNALATTRGNLVIGDGWGPDSHTLQLFNNTSLDVWGSINVGCCDATSNRMIISNSTARAGVDLILGQGNSNARSAQLILHQDPGFASRLSIARNLGIGAGGGNSRVINTRGTIEIGGSLSFDWGGWNHAIILTNAILAVNGATTIGDYNAPWNNTIQLAGPDTRFTTSSLRIGNTGGEHTLRLDGGNAIITAALTIGNGANTNRFVVSGATSRLDAATLTVNANTILAFTIPDAGFAATPLNISGAATLDGTTSIVINADRFLGTATLLTAASVTDLPDASYTFHLRKGRRGKIIHSPNQIKVAILDPSSIFMIR